MDVRNRLAVGRQPVDPPGAEVAHDNLQTRARPAAIWCRRAGEHDTDKRSRWFVRHLPARNLPATWHFPSARR